MVRASRTGFTVTLVLALWVACSSAALAEPKTTIVFPDEPYAVDGGGWIHFMILTSDPTVVYFQNSDAYPLHYDFAVAELPGFAGMTREEFDAVTLHAAGQQAILGTIIQPPIRIPEYGIQLLRQDAYPPETVRDLFNLVRSKIVAAPEVQAFYFPSFDQQASAEQNAGFLASEGITISSAARWSTRDVCAALGWALGRLVYVDHTDIEAAWLAGTLGPGDLLLTDMAPADLPPVSGALTLGPAGGSSNAVIRAQSLGVPFAYLVAQGAQRAESLVGRRIALRVESVGQCRVRLIDADHLDSSVAQYIASLKQLPTPNVVPVQLLGAFSASADSVGLGDVAHFGGTAANFGVVRRSIPANSPVAAAFSFDLWSGYLDQTVSTGRTLRQEIALRLAPYTWPPDMAALDSTLAGIRDLFLDPANSGFSPALESAVLSTLGDPQYTFDPQVELRFRSSSNVEDTDTMSGTGLYGSVAGCLADDLDTGVAGPSACDPGDADEHGAFQAIRGVFASLYNRNAYLERLRLDVDESQIGMAVLVYPSGPSELANGVARVSRTSAGSTVKSVALASQIDDRPVAAPEPGVVAEEARLSVITVPGTPSLGPRSNLLPFGATVLTMPGEYQSLTSLLLLVLQRYGTESGLGPLTLGIEYKKLGSGGTFRIDGVRPILQASQPDFTSQFLINEPGRYCVATDSGSAFAKHRLKLSWELSTLDTWLTPSIVATGFYADSALEYAETCQLYEQTGSLPEWPSATHNYVGGFLIDGFQLLRLQNARTVELRTAYSPGFWPYPKTPVIALGDFGFSESPNRTNNGCLGLRVDYAQAVPDYQSGQPTLTTTDWVSLCRCPEPPELGELLQTRTLLGPAGVSIVTRFYWRPLVLTAVEYTAPLSHFVDTTITGLTPTPIVLTGEYAQSYAASTFNSTEDFLFEPAFSPGLLLSQREALEAAGIRAIFVRHNRSASTSQFTYYDDAAWGGPCLGCTGFDGDHDGHCTAESVPDCDDSDPTAWARPGEVPDLVFLDHDVMAWGVPSSQGGTSLRYDVLRSTSRSSFGAPAICLESDDDSDLGAVDPTVPGALFYYLIRAEDGCVGSLGQRSDGIERTGRSCP